MLPASYGLTQDLWSLRSMVFVGFRWISPLSALYASTIVPIAGKIRKTPRGVPLISATSDGPGDRSRGFWGVLGGIKRST